MTVPTRGTFDDDMQFKDAGLVGDTDAAGTVSSVAKVIDVGSSTTKIRGEMIIDVSALEIASNDEIYDIIIQGSTVAAFATDTAIVDLCSLTLGAAEVQRSDCNADNTTGRYSLLFSNEHAGTIYRYLRIYTVTTGTIATGINYTAHAVPIADV